MTVVVAWKWVGGDGAAFDDGAGQGTSPADEAALEIGLQLAARRGEGGDGVTIVSVGRPAGEPALRAALAAGATRAVRVDAPSDLTSAAAAAALADVVVASGDVRWVVCGDASVDRGSGSVPAFLAAELGWAQALGLVDVETVATDTGVVRSVRRLDGGRREVLAVDPPAVLSVEGSVARLRRASMPAELAARTAAIERRPGPSGPLEEREVVRPYRPRARVRPAPAGSTLERIRELTATGVPAATAETVIAEPPEAAERILQALRAWGYVP